MNVATSLSLVSGIAGLDLGLKLAIPGLRVLGYVERETYAASVLLARMEDESLEPAPIWCGNLEDFDARPFAGVDILTAGLPCQPYSCAGQQKGHEDERAIWPEFIRIVGECRPSMVFLENVPTFVTGGWFRRPGEELSRLGYEIAQPLFLAASDVGAPHIRERVFILAHTSRQRARRRAAGSWHQGIGAADADGGGEELADTQIGGRPNPPVAKSRGHQERTMRTNRGRGCAVANTKHGQRRTGIDHSRWEAGQRAGDGSEALADTMRQRRQQKPGSAQGYEATDEGRAEEHDYEPASHVENMGHAKQLDGRQGPVQPVAIQPPYAWPPGPSDWGRWAEVEEALEPAVCRVADGIPDWMDFARYPIEQLRALGNSVLPIVSATAFRTLCAEMTP